MAERELNVGARIYSAQEFFFRVVCCCINVTFIMNSTLGYIVRLVYYIKQINFLPFKKKR